MRCDEKGLALDKLELTALLKFCHEDPQSSLNFVQFKIDDDYCEAYATNGSASVRATGVSVSDERVGEWFVHRDFISLCARSLESADQVVILAFSGGSIHEATIWEDDQEVSHVGWPHDAAIAQHTIKFPNIGDSIPKGKPGEGCGLFAIPCGYLAYLEKVEKAADCFGAEVYVPNDPEKPVKFRIGAHKETVWTAAICPMRVADLGKELESEKTERKTTRGSKKQGALDFGGGVEEAANNFRESIAEAGGGTVTAIDNKGRMGVKVTIPGKGKASKKAAKKLSKRKR